MTNKLQTEKLSMSRKMWGTIREKKTNLDGILWYSSSSLVNKSVDSEYVSLESKFSLILFVNKLMIRCF